MVCFGGGGREGEVIMGEKGEGGLDGEGEAGIKRGRME